MQCIGSRQAEQSSSPCIWNIIHTGFYVPQPDFKSAMCNLHGGEVVYGMEGEAQKTSCDTEFSISFILWFSLNVSHNAHCIH